MTQKKYKEYQKEIADKQFTRVIKELINLKNQYQIFLDNDEVMKLKKQLRYYKGRADMWKNSFFKLKSYFLRRWGSKGYYVERDGRIGKYDEEKL